MNLFSSEHGIIPACDVDNLIQLEKLINATSGLDFIQGYKIGMILVVENGISQVTKVIRKKTDLPIIYDHQKFGTDIPNICGGKILNILKKYGVDGLIIFPESGIETLRVTIKSCKQIGLTPIVGGEMTHPGYLKSEGGYIADESPAQMYKDAAELGVDYFVIPGTKLDKMDTYKNKLSKIVAEPKFLFPGIGKGQGGDILSAFRTVQPFPSYAIIGRGIYAQKDMRNAAKKLWKTVVNGMNI